MQLENLTLDIEQQIEIKAPAAEVFEIMLARLSDRNTRPGGDPMPMVLERWPGGRWFRDLGENTGHLWGFVQVFKPTTLIEICGPMFMSYPVSGHLSLRLTEDGGKTNLTLRHRGFGLISDEHRQHVASGWEHYLASIQSDCQ